MNENGRRRCCLLSGIGLTLFGCVICALSIALPGWQVVELLEFNSVHEHGIFYDCVRSETTPLEKVRGKDFTFRTSKRCTYKFDSSASRTIRIAVEEGDVAATEMLLHRFLPQHKAVIFFFIFTVIFAMMSMVVGACSPCFVPNGVLHVVSVMTAMGCSLLADFIFFMASKKPDNKDVQGIVNTYQQHLGYAFFVHVFGTLALFAATLSSTVSAYLLIRREWRVYGCCDSKDSQKGCGSGSYCHYPSLTYYGANDLESRMMEATNLNSNVRMPMPAPPPPPPLFATRIEHRRGMNGYEHNERLFQEEDV
ncbi:unnamed protein product [Bursaphelenchus okinawaensis]|uniref:Uncharacterized protein n=1 Tax=Bursaphelenchus okinawaensis TaxID=465554 RepID=A0A811L634_9BILA|nr:unnamed protein product [Bursaphelenchus okinawaensis]CAG9120084.1 unnamed protein product [Bursaphelenchus okinawaensis]